MPIYEHHCLRCDVTFEVIASFTSSRQRPCPECGKPAQRMTSTFAIASGSKATAASEAADATKAPIDPRPLCMKNPHIPLLCHMDEPSARRFIAHANGRGAEYDDKKAAREETRKQRGEAAPKAAAPSHGHAHDFRRHAPKGGEVGKVGHDHGHAHGAKAEKKAHDHAHGQSHAAPHAHPHGHGHAHGHPHRGAKKKAASKAAS
jgi:putative FmdB family regulatory protein